MNDTLFIQDNHNNGSNQLQNLFQERYSARKASTHPNDSSIALTLHNPLYPPGRIIHIVRHHPSAEE